MLKPHVLAWWVLGNDVGLSSLALLAFMERNNLPKSDRYDHPLDPSDLGRCMKLMDIEPSYRERIHEIAVLSPEWAALSEHWSELEALYLEEYPTGYAPKCYARMQELLSDASAQ